MKRSGIDELGPMAAASYMTAVGAILFNTMPVLLGAVADGFGASNDELGLLAAVGLLGASVVLVSSYFWVRRVRWRRHLGWSICSGIAAIAALYTVDSFAGLLIVFPLIGVAMASTFAPALAALSDARDPARAFGFSITAQVLLAAVALFLIPAFAVPRYGFSGVVAVLLALFAPALLLLRWIPDGGERPERPEPPAAEGRVNLRLWALLGIAAMAVYFVGLNGTWAFLERIGNAAGVSGEAIGTALATSMVLGASGAALAGALGQRLPFAPALWASPALFLIFILIALDVRTGLGFTAAALIFNVAWNFSLPYQMNLIANVDLAGRYIVLVPAAQTLGGALGPALSGSLSVAFGLRSIYGLLAGAIAVALVCYLAMARRFGHAEVVLRKPHA